MKCGSVALIGRALVSKTRCWGSESSLARHFKGEKILKIIKDIRYYFLGCENFKAVVERVFNDFTEGCENLIDWFFIIWTDRQWDHMYLTKLLNHKLHKMEKYFRSENFYEGQEKDADNMKICVDALKRIIDDNYEEIAFKEHNEKWGKLNMDWGKENENYEGHHELTLSRPNAITQEQKEQEQQEYMTHADETDKMREDDLDLIFGTMRKEILKWWE